MKYCNLMNRKLHARLKIMHKNMKKNIFLPNMQFIYLLFIRNRSIINKITIELLIYSAILAFKSLLSLSALLVAIAAQSWLYISYNFISLPLPTYCKTCIDFLIFLFFLRMLLHFKTFSIGFIRNQLSVN